MPVTLTTLSNSLIKVRWKEPYASESLNRKLTGAIAPGVYRGLLLGVSASALSVDLSPDPITGDHVAVQEDSSGFSTTFTDDTSGVFTLDLTSYATNDIVVITLVLSYSVGVDTAAEFRGYTLAEYNALSAATQRSLVVLGTVLRPASGIIPSTNIVWDRRSLPFQNRADGLIPWSPLIRNGGFELGETNGTYRHASPFWKTSSSNGNFLIRPVTTEAKTGFKSLEITTSASGVVTVTIQQDLWMPVVAGRYVMGRLWKKAIQAATGSPTGTLRFVFGDQNGSSDVNEDLVFAIDSIDGSFVEFDGIVQVPTGYSLLKSVQIVVAGTYGASGPCIRFDDVQAWSQGSAGNWLDVRDTRVAEGAFGDLFVGPQNSFANNAVKLSSDGTNLIVERRNESSTQTPPAISIQARTTGGITYTLVFQSLPSGVPGYRKYVSSTGRMIETINASWSNGSNLWTKDVNGTPAYKQEIREKGISAFSRVADATWGDGSWIQHIQTSYPDITTDTNAVFTPIVMARDASGNQRVLVDHLGLRAGRVTEMLQNWLPPMTTAWSSHVSGTGTNSDGDIYSTRIPGTTQLQTVNANGDRAGSHSLWVFNSQFVTNQVHVLEFELDCADLIGTPDLQFQAGFMHDEGGDPTSEDYIKISKTSASANWFFNVQKSSGGSTSTDTTVVVGNFHRFRIEYYGSAMPGGARALCYIDGVLRVQQTSNLPDTQGIPISSALKATGVLTNKKVWVSPIRYTATRYLADDAL